MKRIAFYGLFIFFLSNAHAQPSARGKITLPVSNEKLERLENITVKLLKPGDSTLVKTAITGKDGIAEFENIRSGDYIIRISAVHYQPGYVAIFSLLPGETIVELPPARLQIATSELKGVLITGKKPFIQKLNDRIVVNVEGSIISAGSTAMDVLERSPGVTLNQQDAISLRGKQGVIIMIDGKISPMTGEDLVNYLRGLPSSAIERIDIITNPSAKYDAAGNSGIIDIRMKKDQRFGANGTLTAGYGQGVYPKANTGATFNWRNKKLNLFGNASYGYYEYFNNIITRRDFFESENYKGAYDQDNRIKRAINTSSFRLGADLHLSDKTIIGAVVSSNFYLTDRSGQNRSLVLNENNNSESTFLTSAKGEENFDNFVSNINFKHSFDSTGRELSADLDYAVYGKKWASEYITGYYNPDGTASQPLDIAQSDQQGDLRIKALKIDYLYPVSKTKNIEAGVKTSFVKAKNNVLFYDKTFSPPVIDSALSNSFTYDENINAAYFTFNSTIGQWNIQAGLRGEHTHIKTFQVFDKKGIDSSYFLLFPSAFFNYKIKEEQVIGFSVSKRIDRPGYGQLNPFKIYIDPSFFATGDPSLKIPLTWSYEITYTQKQLSFILGYSRTTDVITTVLVPYADRPRVTIQGPVNMTLFDYYGITVTSPMRINSWWNVIGNANIYIARYKGYISETKVNTSNINAAVSANNNFSFKKNWTAEVGFNYYSGNNNGLLKDRPSWVLGAGLQKIIWQNRLVIRANATDILYRQWPRFESRFTNYHEKLSAIRDTRVVNLTLTYRFGNNKVQAARRRVTGSEEERRRAQ